jgi:hypothetical protein
MEKQVSIGSKKGKSLIILGFVSIGILFLIYSRLQNPGLTPDSISALDRLAVGFYLVFLMSLGAISYGLYRYHKHKADKADSSLLSIIAISTYNKKSRKIFVATFIVYGIFFSLTSGTLVYQPDVVFSYHYGAQVPSAHITPCCGEPGYMPKIIVYLTEHLGLQIIPINLLLQVIVSYLVGLNVVLAVFAIPISKRTGSLSGVGATTGLFIACPTCVGTFLSLFIGSATAVVFAVAITQLQTLLILITIPVLLATPFIFARKIKAQGICDIGTGIN